MQAAPRTKNDTHVPALIWYARMDAHPDVHAGRIQDAKSTVVLTCNGTMRGSKKLSLKSVVDKALVLTEAADHHVSACGCLGTALNPEPEP